MNKILSQIYFHTPLHIRMVYGYYSVHVHWFSGFQ